MKRQREKFYLVPTYNLHLNLRDRILNDFHTMPIVKDILADYRSCWKNVTCDFPYYLVDKLGHLNPVMQLTYSSKADDAGSPYDTSFVEYCAIFGNNHCNVFFGNSIKELISSFNQGSYSSQEYLIRIW